MLATHAVLVMAAVATVAGHGERRRPLVVGGGDPSRGVLVNRTPGVPPFAAPDLARPTVVFIHGFNPMPRTVHFGMAQCLADALAKRPNTPPFNLLEWDWNAATFEGLSVRRNVDASVHQGHGLASALLASGLDPSRIHLIGHSAGGLVATSAAWDFLHRFGRPVAHLTLLEPAAFYHSTIFDQLAAGSLAPRVENYWSHGPSAYGREVPHAGVINHKFAGPTPYLGVVCPLRSDHLSVVRWYCDTIADPRLPCGFNASLLLAAGP